MEYGARKFKICEEKKFAYVNGKSTNFICYGSVICHAFHNYIQKIKQPITENDFQTYITEIIDHIKKLLPYEIPNVLKLYPVKVSKNDRFGFMLIDESNGCFPLFFDIESHASKYPRLNALNKVLEKILENY